MKSAMRMAMVVGCLLPGCTPDLGDTEPIPKSYVSAKGVSLHLEGRGLEGRFEVLKIRLINRAPSPITFQGGSESWPSFEIQRWEGGGWDEFPSLGGICGNPFRTCVMQPNRSSLFLVPMLEDEGAFRVGIWYGRDGEKPASRVVWSARIDR